MAVKVIYKHWKTGMHLEVIGVMPKELNHENSERFVIKRSKDGVLEDRMSSPWLKISF